MSDLRVRPAESSDLARVTAIYNHYVVDTAITFDIEPREAEERRGWYLDHTSGAGHRLLVVEEGSNLLGYAGSGTFRAKRAYDTTVETTVYLDPTATGRGLGTLLYAALFDSLAGEDVIEPWPGSRCPIRRRSRCTAASGFARWGYSPRTDASSGATGMSRGSSGRSDGRYPVGATRTLSAPGLPAWAKASMPSARG